MTQIKLYLDDIRDLPGSSYTLVRSYEDAIAFIKANGIQPFILFDHDLGVDINNILLPTGYDFAKWLVDMDMENIYKFPKDFTFNVHSANLVGKAKIQSYLNNYLSFRKTL